MADRVDEFESIFKRASKARFQYDRPIFKTVVLITDSSASESDSLLVLVQRFLTALQADQPRWHVINGDGYDRVSNLLEQVVRVEPNLIITCRNLQQTNKNTPHSLGVYLDTLTQASPIPVLVLPDEPADREAEKMRAPSSIMVITDHLAGESRLINYAVSFTGQEGHLHLCHVEDDAAFAYYMNAIERIPTIDTQTAESALREQLLKQSADYIQNCLEVLRQEQVSAQLHAHVLMGHRLQDYRRLLDEYQVELLVLNTKDQDQLAMHGLAYPIAVEFRDVPLLML